MSIISQRAGRVNIRVGGNTQETATLVDSLADGKALEKDKEDTSNPVRNDLDPLFESTTFLKRDTDRHTCFVVHTGDHIHARKRLCTCEHQMVLGCAVVHLFDASIAPADERCQKGIPFNDTNNLRLGIAEVGEAILGDNLLGFQAANEPDLYAGCVQFHCVLFFLHGLMSVGRQSRTSCSELLTI